jgi:nitroreductase
MTGTQFQSIEAKKADNQFPIEPAITKRWSARAFSSKPIEQSELNRLFEAARWTASSMNEQPWIYLYALAADKENFQRYFDCLMMGNQLWCKYAKVLVLSLAKKNFEKTGTPNRHYMHDVGAANTQLLIQAAAQDIYGHMLGGFDMQKTIETFSIPDHLEPVCFIALGYLDHHEILEEPFKSRELAKRSRIPISEFVFNADLPKYKKP